LNARVSVQSAAVTSNGKCTTWP